ncbi:phage tail protein I [Profundibacterium mesophilum]|uniref:Phage tail protein I n=1 Tax=Profundibacterium mesophilum KAUST100406-0324 TaxID=1037889 RepID=A0A921NWH1_9RHOB|nr:phage tail protein I [Profundibacterium mesophilum]KAF0676735.1 putative phage tail protein I [Profundibacterium mesophilum KAUST100406-0324]
MSESILPPNAAPAELALEAGIRAGKPQLGAVATLMDPARCPPELLSWLAWAMSVDVWDPGWDTQTKRAVIARSIFVHRRKGTRAAVEEALTSAGLRLDLSEWWEHGGVPHTFRIDAYASNIARAGRQVDTALITRIKALIERTKPARSHYVLRIGYDFETRLAVRTGALARTRQAAILTPRPAPRLASTRGFLRSGGHLRVTSLATHHLGAAS